MEKELTTVKILGIAQKYKEILLYFIQKEGNHSFFKATVSHDGFTFEDRSKYVFALDTTQKEEQQYNWEHIRVAKEGDVYILLYKNTSDPAGKLYSAISTDFSVWQQIGQVEGITETATVVDQYLHNEQFVMYYGDRDISIAYSDDLIAWDKTETPLLSPREGFFDDSDLEVANAYEQNENILLAYYVKKVVNGETRYSVGAAYFDKNNPSKLLWRSDEPLYALPDEFYKDTIRPLGCAFVNDALILYWAVNDNTIFSVSCPLPVIHEVPTKKLFSILVKKFKDNPIIAPRPEVAWESRATFNSAALYEDGKVHFLYRALGDTDLSVLGYATSTDGLTIDHRSDMPAYIPREPFETPGNNAFNTLAEHFVSGGGYGGVEDPRITRVEDKVYLTYVAFDGATPPRAAMSSISIDDFLKNNWERWDKPILISAPGMVNKSAVVFPRKVNGKYVVMHRVYPNILIDYLDDLEFTNYLQGHHFIPPRKHFWDSKKIGAGAPPIETKDGWLLIYQSVGYQDPGRYKIGAMMLDINNPSKVLYRTHSPLIEPEEHYENNGFKAGVVYPCGAVVMDDKLHIYYGGSDSYLCAASANVDEFLSEMKHHQEPRLKSIHAELIH